MVNQATADFSAFSWIPGGRPGVSAPHPGSRLPLAPDSPIELDGAKLEEVSASASGSNGFDMGFILGRVGGALGVGLGLGESAQRLA